MLRRGPAHAIILARAQGTREVLFGWPNGTVSPTGITPRSTVTSFLSWPRRIQEETNAFQIPGPIETTLRTGQLRGEHPQLRTKACFGCSMFFSLAEFFPQQTKIVSACSSMSSFMFSPGSQNCNQSFLHRKAAFRLRRSAVVGSGNHQSTIRILVSLHAWRMCPTTSFPGCHNRNLAEDWHSSVAGKLTLRQWYVNSHQTILSCQPRVGGIL